MDQKRLDHIREYTEGMHKPPTMNYQELLELLDAYDERDRLRAEEIRLSEELNKTNMAYCIAQETADGYYAGLTGKPEPRGMTEAGLAAFIVADNMRKALQPFADEAEIIDRQHPGQPDSIRLITWCQADGRFTLGDLRRARSVMKKVNDV